MAATTHPKPREQASLGRVHRPGVTPVIAALIVAYGVAAVAWQVLRTGDPADEVVLLLTDVPLSALAVACALLAARRAPTVGGRRAWLLIGLAFAAFGLGDVAWAYMDAAPGGSPFPSIADVGYLAFYPLLLIGLLVLPRERPKTPVGTVLDLAIVVVGSGTVVWWLVLEPVAAASSSAPEATLVALAYPVLDLLVLFALAAALMSRLVGTSRTALVLLAIGIILNVVADLSYARLSLEGAYQAGAWMDSAWSAAWTAMCLAGVIEVRTIGAVRPAGAVSVTTRPLSFIPYLAVAGLFGLLLGATATGGSAPTVLVVGATFVTGLVMGRQVIERRQFEAELRDQAYHDPLTGLANRTLFVDRIDQALRRSRRGGGVPSLLYLDLDDFKTINDSLGHAVGDRVLVEIAGRLAGVIRAVDTAARLGGDEFAILLEETRSVEEAVVVAGRIQAVLRPLIEIDGSAVGTGASIGIVRPDARASASMELLRDADIAMYAAKREARGSYRIFDPAMLVATVERANLASGGRAVADGGPAPNRPAAAI